MNTHVFYMHVYLNELSPIYTCTDDAYINICIYMYCKHVHTHACIYIHIHSSSKLGVTRKVSSWDCEQGTSKVIIDIYTLLYVDSFLNG